MIKLINVLYYTILTLTILVSCNSDYQIKSTNCSNDILNQAKSDKVFLEEVLASYKEFILRESIHEIYRDSFELNDNLISAEIIYSTHKGIFAYFNKNRTKEINITCTKFPALQYYFLGLDSQSLRSTKIEYYQQFQVEKG